MKNLQENNGNDRKRFLDFYQERYQHLNGLILKESAGAEKKNPLLNDAYARFAALNGKGKRYRGVLAYIGCLLAGNPNLSEADALAEAYEIFQTAVLIHDDIADRGDLRRGMTTIHKQYSQEFRENLPDCTPQGTAELDHTAESVTLCIGDIGFYLGEQKLVEAYSRKPYFGALLDYYHRALIRTLEGELLDIQLPCLERYGMTEKMSQGGITDNMAGKQKGNGTRGIAAQKAETAAAHQADVSEKGAGVETAKTTDLEALITDIHELKTSSYTVTGPLCAGMLLGNASPETISQMEKIGNKVGRAFQIKDDLDGIFAKTGATGKDAASDISEFKTTFLYAYVKKQGGRPYEELLKYYGKQTLSESEIRTVQSIFHDTGAAAHSRQIMDILFTQSRQELDHLQGVSEEGKLLFSGFLSFLEQKETV